MNVGTAQEVMKFLEFIWQGQEGWFELAIHPDQRRLLRKEDALASFEDKRFFAPLARVRHGSTGQDVAIEGNVIWADIDSLDALEPIRVRLQERGVTPSATLFSGNKGYWIYLKLDRSIPTDQIEELNKRLALLLDGDTCWDRPRIARLPGSVHPDSGNEARMIQFSRTLHNPIELGSFLPVAPAVQRPIIAAPSAMKAKPVAFGPVPPLGPKLLEYMRLRPGKSEGFDRSQIEYTIFLTLLSKGWQEDAIISFAESVQLARHSEERVRHGDFRWTQRSVANARAYLEQTHREQEVPPMCMETRRLPRPQLNRLDVLQLVSGQSMKELTSDIRVRSGHSERTVRDAVVQLENAELLTRTRQGRHTKVSLTAKGLRQVTSGFDGLFVPTIDSVRTGEPRVRGW